MNESRNLFLKLIAVIFLVSIMGSVQAQKKINSKGARNLLSDKEWKLSTVWQQKLNTNYEPLGEQEETFNYSPMIPKISLKEDGSFTGEFCDEPESCESKEGSWSVKKMQLSFDGEDAIGISGVLWVATIIDIDEKFFVLSGVLLSDWENETDPKPIRYDYKYEISE